MAVSCVVAEIVGIFVSSTQQLALWVATLMWVLRSEDPLGRKSVAGRRVWLLREKVGPRRWTRLCRRSEAFSEHSLVLLKIWKPDKVRDVVFLEECTPIDRPGGRQRPSAKAKTSVNVQVILVIEKKVVVTQNALGETQTATRRRA